MFSDSHNFEIEGGEVTHTREIGEDSTWADRVINGVHLDDSCYWNNQSDYLTHLKELSENQEKTNTMLNDRSMPNVFHESVSSDNSDQKGTGSSKNWMGHGKSVSSKRHRNWIYKNQDLKSVNRPGDKTFFRKRKIPRSKHKNYTVKPQSEVQKEKNKVNQEKYSEIAHSNEFEEMVKTEYILDELRNEYLEDQEYEDYPDVEYRISSGGLGLYCHGCCADYYDMDDLDGKEIAFIENGMVVTKYDTNNDTYVCEYSNSWAGRRKPQYLGYVMWCPPKEWMEPTVDWEKIWLAMDYKRTGLKRSYNFTKADGRGWPKITFNTSRL